MSNNDHCFSQLGDRGSIPLVLPMKDDFVYRLIKRRDPEFFDHDEVMFTSSNQCHRKPARIVYNTDIDISAISFVVNGADPKAKIKHIIQAASQFDSKE